MSSDPSLHLDYYQSWYDYFCSVLSKSLKVKSKKRLDVPFFISFHAMHLLNKRETVTRKLSKTFSTKLAFQGLKLNEDIGTSIELDRFSLVEQLNLKNTKHCYRLLRSLKSNSLYPSSMFFGSIKVVSSFEKTQLFITFFSSVFKAGSCLLPELQAHGSIHLEDVSFTIDDVYNLLSRIPDDLSMGMDAIPSFVLKECAQQLSPLVFEFFLRITKTQQWPSQWKTSTVTPLHKSGSTSDVTNYRPISILPKLSVVFERLIFNFIYLQVCSKKSEQHGFMKHRSTVTQLISYLDKVYAAKDTTHDCLTVYFDVKKAFDSVSNGLRLHKLSSFGFDHNLLTVFQSLLTGRKQVVKVEGCSSSEAVVTSGVPQGSVLGPFLFITMLQTQYNILKIFLIAMTLKCFLFLQSTKFKMI